MIIGMNVYFYGTALVIRYDTVITLKLSILLCFVSNSRSSYSVLCISLG
jgi:hypothetical protein